MGVTGLRFVRREKINGISHVIIKDIKGQTRPFYTDLWEKHAEIETKETA